ncbi:MAG: hypothetical protein OEX12_00310 [Gammaproteobacteria bacterium]|nr:hypothetical protein [Gammaproteobacteria bacterium]
MEIEISPKQATLFMKLGYSIKCFVDVPSAEEGQRLLEHKTKRKGGKRIPPDTLIMYSSDGEIPTVGMMAEIWKKIEKKLWKNDVTKAYTRKAFDTAWMKEVMALGYKFDPSTFSYLLNRKRCIRIAEER